MKKITTVTIAFSAITLALGTSVFAANPATPGTPAANQGKMMQQKREHRHEMRQKHKEKRLQHHMDKMQQRHDMTQKHREKMMQKRQHMMQPNHPSMPDNMPMNGGRS